MEEFNHWRERQDYQKEMKRKDCQDLIVYGVCIIGLGVLVWISL